MKDNLIYFDNNATTKISKRTLEAMQPFLEDNYANPSSMYPFAKKVGDAVDKAREQVVELMGASEPREIIFTASGTESANIAIKGALYNTTKKHIITTKVEHSCVLNLYKFLEKKGYRVTYLNVNSEGLIDLDQLEESVCDDTALVSCMWANNETGVIFPVDEIATIVKRINPEALIFVDGVQAAGKIPMDVKSTKIDMVSISGHKLHAPKGVAALYIKKGTMIKPIIIGGHQERGLRAGTHNVASIVALGEASIEAMEYLEDEDTRIRALRDKLELNILKRIYNAKVNGSRTNRVPNTTNIGFEFIEGELILLHMADLGICASSGSACTSGSLEPSHVLKAMGVPFTALHGSVRFSLGRYTTEEEVDFVIENLPAVIERLNGYSPFQKELAELKDIKTASV